MGLFSAVGSFVSGVASSIGNAIGGAFSSVTSGLGMMLDKIGTGLGTVLEKIGSFANTLLRNLGFIKPDQDTPDLGDRALQAAEKGLTPDKFPDFKSYLAALRDFPLDPEMSQKYKESEKLIAGIGVGTIGIGEKFNRDPASLRGLWLLPVVNADYFTPERVQGLLAAGRLSDDIFAYLEAYLEKRLSMTETREFEKQLEANADGSPMTEAQRDALYDALHTGRDNWSKLCQAPQNAPGQPGGVER